jgi:hypothetical protein
MTEADLRDAIVEAFGLLCEAKADEDLVDAQKWLDQCDKWLDKYPPSKVRQAVHASGGAS